MKNFFKENWEIRTLGEIADLITGNGVTKEQLGSGDFPAVKNEDISSKIKQQFKECINFVNPNLIKNPKYFSFGDLLISNMGGEKNIGRTCVYLGEGTCIAGNHVIIVKHKQNPKYLAYALSTEFCREQIISLSQKGTVWDLYSSNIKKIKIPIPPRNIQDQIVEYLDKFTNLSEELSKELKERKEQYEYFRDKIIGRNEEEMRKK